MAASPKIKIKLVSSEGTGCYYTTTVNPRNLEGKLKRRKYDKKLRKHVMFEQAKIK